MLLITNLQIFRWTDSGYESEVQVWHCTLPKFGHALQAAEPEELPEGGKKALAARPKSVNTNNEPAVSSYTISLAKQSHA